MPRIRIEGALPIPEGEVRRIDADGLALAVVDLGGGRLCAFRDACSHMGARLSEGELDLERLTIRCPWHGSLFDLQTGTRLRGPARRPVTLHQVQTAGAAVLVDLDP